MDTLTIKRMDSEQLSYKTKLALIDIIRANGADGKPFKLPNEDVLSQRLGVSRNVLRDALMSLEELGIVTRRRSKGTIASPEIANATCRLDSDPELYLMLKNAGYSVQVETIRLGVVFEQDPVLGDAEFYLNSEKLFLADGTPAAVCIDHISGKYADSSNETVLQLKTLSHRKFMEQVCHVSMAYTLSHIDPALPEPWLAERMRLSPGEPVLFMDDYVYSHDHDVIAHSNIWFRRGMNLKFLRKSWA